MASRRLSSKISANQREEKTSWNVNKHWKIRESTRQLQGSFLMSSLPITISLDFFNTEIQLPETYLQALLPFLVSPPEPRYFKIVFRETFEIISLVTHNNVSKHLYFFFAGQIWIWIHSLVHLILKLQKLSLDHLGYVFCYPEYQEFLKPF